VLTLWSWAPTWGWAAVQVWMTSILAERRSRTSKQCSC